jgi:putative transposase
MKTQVKRVKRFQPATGEVPRKVTYRLYPTEGQKASMLDMKGAHMRLYNAFLEQRRLAWRRQGISLGKSEQSAELTRLRQEDSEIGALNAQSCQVTLNRVDLAFQAFFRRVKAGEEPGYPRFKTFNRFSGWGYKTHGDGWTLMPGEKGQHGKHGKLRLSGVGNIRIRGGMRDEGTPKTCEIMHRHGKWYVSVTIDCKPVRGRGYGAIGFDWGIEHFLTVERDDGSFEDIDNPRWLRSNEAKLKDLYRSRDAKTKFSRAWRFVNRQIARWHSKIARQRQDWHHKLSARLVHETGAIFTEKLAIKNMSKRPKPKPGEKPGEWSPNGAAAKSGLNKSILDGAPAQFLSYVRYKAANAGITMGEAPTQKLKPSQRCRECGQVEAKRLDQRWHLCDCGYRTSRDRTSAGVCLDWGMEHFLVLWLACLHTLGSGTVPEGFGPQNLHLESPAI